MAKVLVVGGAGYIGGALTDLLLQSRHKVRVYDALLYEESYRKPVEFVLGDVRDWESLTPHLKWADVVVWLAAIVGDGACALDPELTTEINEIAVKNLAERFDGRVIFTSTCSVYGAQDGLLYENSPTAPLSVYAATKLNSEVSLEGKNALIFRLGTLFGVGDCFSRIRLDLVVNVLTVKAVLQRKISVFGGAQYRPLLHVRDAAETIFQNLETEYTGIFNLHVVNIRILDLAEQFLQHFPDLEIQRTELKFEDNRNYRVSSERASTLLSFKPRFVVDDGIAELKAIIKEGRIKNIRVPRHSNQRFLKDFLEQPSSPLGFEVPVGI
jgi:nucleoside-diphosphate-sugar epimerase